jgi:hypothetical protein
MAPALTVDVQRSGDYRYLVLNDGPVGWWPLSDVVSSVSAVDSSGNLHNGTPTGVTFGAAGHRPDGATVATFNGTTSRIAIADAAIFHLGDVGSIECWVKRSAVSLGALVVLFDGNTNAVALQIDTDNKIRVAKSGGLQIVKSTVAIADTTTWHHIAYTKNGSASTLYLDGVNVTGAVTDQTLSNSNGLTIGATPAPASFYPGALSDVAYYSYALSAAAVLAHATSGVWTSLSLSEEATHISRGYQSNRPDDRIAPPSTFACSLNNSSSNAAATAGLYSTDRGLLAGWQEGILLRVQVTANGNTRTRFWGWIDTIDTDAGLYGDQRVHVTAVGWTAFAAKAPALGLSVQAAVRDDQLLPLLTALVPTQPYATAFATGLETYPLAFDDINPAQAMVLDVCDGVVMSGFYRMHEAADGTIVGESRQTRQLFQPVDALTITDVAPGGQPGLALVEGLRASRRLDRVMNQFIVTLTPRRVDASPVVVYSLPLTGTPLVVPPLSSVTFVGNFFDPAQPSQPLSAINLLISDGGAGAVIGAAGFLPTGDFQFGTAFGLTDMTAFATVAVVYEGNRATFTVTNSDTERQLVATLLQCRGQGVYTYQQAVAVAADTASMRIRGKNSVSLTCPYQADQNFAASAAQYLLHMFGPSKTQLDQAVPLFIPNTDEVTLDAILAQEISAPVSISESVIGLAAGKYWLDGLDEEYDERVNASLQLRLTPRDPQPYWSVGVAGYSEAGTTTFAGF